ncbi:MAG TPA: Gfo/Idh/MocA family oxidoreductase [Phycisphaerales bacterium]|nr:Gfo/Idh/MocA family oxidoreductase [Phycisphaerales bacterium]
MIHPKMDRREFLAAAGGLAAVSLLPSVLPAAVRLDQPLTIGLIGVGRQGRAILTELATMESVKVVAVCDTDDNRLTSGKSRAAGADGFADYKAMLSTVKALDAVIIATPTHQHRQIAEDCIAAGKHVYCEAPLAHTAADAQAIARAAAGMSSGKKVFAVGFEGRANPVYQLARSFFRTDAFNDMIAMRAQFAQKTSWRFSAPDADRERRQNWRLDKGVSTGMIGEIASHQLDVAHWYRGQLPVSVRATGGIRLWNDGREIADTVHAAFTYEDGAVFNWFGTLCSSFLGREEIFIGSSSTIKLGWSHGWMFKESDAPTQGWEVYANKQQFHNDVGITLIAGATKLAEQGKLKDGVGLPNSSLYYSLESFIKAAAGQGKVACSAADGARSTIISILANQALIEKGGGGELKIDPAVLKVEG